MSLGIPLMKDQKNIVITGGNSGIGLETIKGLYADGHNIIFGSRNQQKNEEVVEQITMQEGGKLQGFVLDLSKKQSIEKFVKNVKDNFKHIDILINNAGLMLQERQESQLGFEMTLTINHFGPFYLTYMLFDLIKDSKEGRIINVSSQAHYQAPSRFFEDLGCNKKSYGKLEQYYISKMFIVLFTVGLKNLFEKNKLTNLKTASLHPGIVSTNFGKDIFLCKCFRALCCCFIITSDQGAICSLSLCRRPFDKLQSGEYHDKEGRYQQMDERARDFNMVSKLWEISENAYKIKFQ